MNPTPYVVGDIARLPLHNHEGEVIGWATIDAEDFDALAQHRWHRHSGHAARNVGHNHRKLPLDRAVLGLPPGRQCAVTHLNGQALDCRRSNLVLNKTGLAKALEDDPAVKELATRRAVARLMGTRAPTRIAAA